MASEVSKQRPVDGVRARHKASKNYDDNDKAGIWDRKFGGRVRKVSASLRPARSME